MGELVCYDEIAELIGVKPGTVRVWHTRHLLPDPVVPSSPARTNHRPQWDRDQILLWAQNTGRHTDLYRESVAAARGSHAVILEPRPGAETGFEREMRLAREAARK